MPAAQGAEALMIRRKPFDDNCRQRAFDYRVFCLLVHFITKNARDAWKGLDGARDLFRKEGRKKGGWGGRGKGHPRKRAGGKEAPGSDGKKRCAAWKRETESMAKRMVGAGSLRTDVSKKGHPI